jgi:hypothetical protein
MGGAMTDDNPELDHITTALLEICRQATEQIRIVVSPEEVL